MRGIIKQLPVSFTVPKIRLTPTQALKSVTSKNGLGVYASSDRLFKGAVFGRDSLEVADDLMYIKPGLVEKILLTIASLQGETEDQRSEEEPGKIIHEYRTPIVDGKPLNSFSQDIYDRLSDAWGGNQRELAYYGSIDSTPHFIKTLAVYCQSYGLEILTEKVKLRSGKSESLIVILEDAIDWLTRHLDSSKSGFVEYLRKNPRGIENQVWKDSKEFYVHKSGQLANHQRPISSIEVQGLAYDALILAGELLPSKKQRLETYASKLRGLVFEKLWKPHENYFALGTDFDEKGGLRIIETLTANPVELLDSLIFDKISDEQRREYVTAIVREIMGTAFLTDAGIRSRSLSEAELVDFWDYHGSYVTWPKETYDAAKGMRRQGFPALARELENRLLNVVKATNRFPEFIYVDGRGRVLGVPTKSLGHGEIVFVDSSNQPEKVQAWTISALVAIQNQRLWHLTPKTNQQDWQSELEKEVLRHIPLVPRLRSARELAARYPAYPYELNDKEK